MAKQKRRTLRWHPAFYAGMKIELEEDAQRLEFREEHTLGSEPVRADLLVIKKKDDGPIRKSIGKIFRKYNIFEYKSPRDVLSVDAFYKGCAYVSLYKALTGSADEVKITELTLSFVCSHYPARLIGHLEQVRGFSVSETMPGIYYVEGNMVPTQIILLDALSDEESLWLKSLTDHIAGDGDIDRLLESYEKHFTDPHYRTVMDIVVRANRRRFEEMKSKYLCDALVELFEDELNEKAEKRAEKLAEKRAEQLAEKRAEQLAEKKANQLATEMVKKRQETAYGNLIQTCRELGASKEVSVEQLVKRYKLEPKEAEAFTEQYWD